MTLILECDRCHNERNEIPRGDTAGLPASWIQADGNDLCPECAKAFKQFMQPPPKQSPILVTGAGGGTAAAAAILSPFPPDSQITKHWAAKVDKSKCETIEVTPREISRRDTPKAPRLVVSWQGQGPGYSFASVWDENLFLHVFTRVSKKTLFYITRKEKFITIVGVRA